ncbi:MAG: tyrosine-protein phosphatase [Pseudomonadota bacterium]
MSATDLQSQLNDPRREIELDYAENVRDLGGYTNRDGQETRWRQFVRAGDMDKLSADDQGSLLEYPLACVIDLRMEKEYRAAANVFADGTQLRFHHHDFWGTRFDHYRSRNKGASGPRKLADLYCSGLVESGFVMGAIFATFAEPDLHGYAFHCRSGKDRTGLVAALLLALADVPADTIAADFALTANYLKGEVHVLPDQPGAYLRECRAETMHYTLEFIANEYDGVRGYLRANGVSEAQMVDVRNKLIAAG